MSEKLNITRPLGMIGVEVPVIGYGTAPLGKEKNIPHAEGVRCLHHAIDCGITYLDTSCDYGSEPVLGEVMRTRRDEVFLATKTNKRSKDGALEELRESLGKLETDHVELIQVHQVNTWADLEQVLAPDGVVAGLEQARQEGLVRFIGITGHARPEILGHAVYQYPFDTVLVALGIGDRLVSGPENFLLPRAGERNLGIIAMKVYGHGVYTNRELCLRYSLGLPGVSLAIIGLDNTQQIDEVVRLANAYQPLSDEERDQLIQEVRPIVEKDAKESEAGKSQLFWLHDTAVLGWREQDEPVLVSY